MKIIIIIFLISWLTIQTCGLNCFKCHYLETRHSSTATDYLASDIAECVANPSMKYSETCTGSEYCTWTYNNDHTEVLDRGCSNDEWDYPRNGCKRNKCGCDSGDNCNDKKFASQAASLTTLQCIDCYDKNIIGYWGTDCAKKPAINKYSKPCIGKDFLCVSIWNEDKTIDRRACYYASFYSAKEKESQRFYDGECRKDSYNVYRCGCKTDNCNNALTMSILLTTKRNTTTTTKRPAIVSELHCYQCANYEDSSTNCHTPTDEFLKPCPNKAESNGIPHYCTTEVYGNLVRRRCESDLPRKKYVDLNGCNEYQDFEYAGLTKYCACKTNKCNNGTVSSNVDKLKGLSIRIFMLMLFLIKVVI